MGDKRIEKQDLIEEPERSQTRIEKFDKNRITVAKYVREGIVSTRKLVS